MQNEHTPPNYLFFKWYLQWQKDNVDTMLIFFQIPNMVHPLDPIAMAGDNAVLLLHLDLRGQEFDAHHKDQIQIVIDAAKEFGVDVYIHKKVVEQYPLGFDLLRYALDPNYLITKNI